MPGHNIAKKYFQDSAAFDRYSCVDCKLLLKEPVQTWCGHRLCKSCADELLGSRGGPAARCPECREQLDDWDEDGVKVSRVYSSWSVFEFKNCSPRLHIIIYGLQVLVLSTTAQLASLV